MDKNGTPIEGGKLLVKIYKSYRANGTPTMKSPRSLFRKLLHAFRASVPQSQGRGDTPSKSS